MSLKALVQLFAEKFLVSKKESVQDWTYPSIANRIAIQFSSTEDDIIYTPPSDGWLQVYARNTGTSNFAVDINATNNSSVMPRVLLTTSGWYCNVYRVRKGVNVKITVPNSISERWAMFLPFN